MPPVFILSYFVDYTEFSAVSSWPQQNRSPKPVTLSSFLRSHIIDKRTNSNIVHTFFIFLTYLSHFSSYAHLCAILIRFLFVHSVHIVFMPVTDFDFAKKSLPVFLTEFLNFWGAFSPLPSCPTWIQNFFYFFREKFLTKAHVHSIMQKLSDRDMLL